MSENSADVRCDECGAILNELPSIQPDQRVPCMTCGSLRRIFDVSISAKAVFRSKLGMKAKHSDAKKPFVESITGDDLHRKTGKWMKLSRLIDRENNLYREEVKDPATGDIIRRCEEALSDHKGHGSTKRPKP